MDARSVQIGMDFACNPGMEQYGNEYDVTQSVKVTDVQSVSREVCRLYSSLYPNALTTELQRAFVDTGRLFHGDYPGYLPCDTPYHDLQHTLDVTLAMARLVSGHESRRPKAEQIGAFGALLGLVSALLHDAGYIRRRMDRHHAKGAEYTRTHVSRSGRFIAEYLPTLGLDKAVQTCAYLVHFTGYEMPASEIPLKDPKLRLLGKMLGTADLIAQMSDRCYLEKCRDRLYPEFEAAGMLARHAPGGSYTSQEELIFRTPMFFEHAMCERLDGVLKGAYHHADQHFFPESNFYMEALEKNRDYLMQVVEHHDASMLRRRSPPILAASALN